MNQIKAIVWSFLLFFLPVSTIFYMVCGHFSFGRALLTAWCTFGGFMFLVTTVYLLFDYSGRISSKKYIVASADGSFPAKMFYSRKSADEYVKRFDPGYASLWHRGIRNYVWREISFGSGDLIKAA